MDDVINKIQSNWSKDIIIRYLYIKLAPYFHRDLKYFLATSEEKERQYQVGFINRFPNIVCSTLADFYVELFKEFNIKAKKVIANSSKIPLFALIVEGDNGWYFLNPLEDLFNNQYNLKPASFGIIPRFRTIKINYPYLTLLPQDYIVSLDDYLQAQDRIHRISQTKECNIYNIMIRGSIDEWIHRLLLSKEKAAALVQNDISKSEYKVHKLRIINVHSSNEGLRDIRISEKQVNE